jgi:hypothetical protein
MVRSHGLMGILMTERSWSQITAMDTTSHALFIWFKSMEANIVEPGNFF